jgi:hypothetical protein
MHIPHASLLDPLLTFHSTVKGVNPYSTQMAVFDLPAVACSVGTFLGLQIV